MRKDLEPFVDDIIKGLGDRPMEAALTHGDEDVFSTFHFYTVPDLTEAERQPPGFLIDGMLPVGMSFLSGAPKTRKSFLALQIAISVATGTSFFGRKVEQADVVYLDLEGSKSRISTRAAAMSVQIPRNIFVANELPEKLADGLTERLRDLHRQRPSIRLIVIDTYSRARGNYRGGGANAYDQDVAFLEPVQRMALDEKLAILFVHHDKKGAGFMADSFERLSGTMGISGSADCVMNLITDGKRFDGRATLEYTPRDAVGGELKLTFDQMSGEWMAVIDSAKDLMGNPLCRWLVENRPDARKEGVFVPYEQVYSEAFRSFSEKPGDMIREQVLRHRAELFSSFGLGVQIGVQSHGKRGIRIVSFQ